MFSEMKSWSGHVGIDRRLSSAIRVFVVFMLAVCLFPESSPGQPEAKEDAQLTSARAAELLARALKSRTEAAAWHCQISIRGFTLSGETRFDYHEAWEAKVDKRRLLVTPMRVDPFDRGAQQFTWKARFAAAGNFCVGCYNEETLAYFVPKDLARQGQNPALSIYDEEAAGTLFHLMDPREIGVIPRQLAMFAEMSGDEFYQWDPKYVTVGPPAAAANVVGTLVTVERVPGNRMTFLLDGRHDDLPVVVTHEYRLDGTAERHVMEIAYEKKSGDWLPTSVSYTHEKDKKMAASEEIRVRTIGYDEPFGEGVFTLESLGVPPGTTVNWGTKAEPPGDPGTLRFDGEKIAASRP